MAWALTGPASWPLWTWAREVAELAAELDGFDLLPSEGLTLAALTVADLAAGVEGVEGVAEVWALDDDCPTP